MRIRLLLWTSLTALAVACGSQEPPNDPTLFVNTTKLGFGQELNSGTFIGTTGFNSVFLRNDGVKTLTIASANLSGDSAFSINQPLDKTTLDYKDSATMTIAFVPHAPPKVHTGTLTITSDAKNTPTVTVSLSGCGVNPVTPDLSICENSTDFPQTSLTAE